MLVDKDREKRSKELDILFFNLKNDSECDFLKFLRLPHQINLFTHIRWAKYE